MTLKEQIEEQEKIRRIATAERNRLIDLRIMCTHNWVWDMDMADLSGTVFRTCTICGKDEIFVKEQK